MFYIVCTVNDDDDDDDGGSDVVALTMTTIFSFFYALITAFRISIEIFATYLSDIKIYNSSELCCI